MDEEFCKLEKIWNFICKDKMYEYFSQFEDIEDYVYQKELTISDNWVCWFNMFNPNYKLNKELNFESLIVLMNYRMHLDISSSFGYIIKDKDSIDYIDLLIDNGVIY